MLAKTPVTQRSPCYSAVSALFMIPLPDHSNYSPFLPHPLPHSGSIRHSLVPSGQTLYQAAPLETITSLLQRFTAESSRNSGEMQYLDKTSRGKCRCSLSKLLSVYLRRTENLSEEQGGMVERLREIRKGRRERIEKGSHCFFKSSGYDKLELKHQYLLLLFFSSL